MSIVVRYNPPSLTTEQYDEADRLLREAGVEPLPDGLECHACFGSEGNLRVSEIAYDVGFQSLTQFNRTFKRVFGQSPSEFRAHVSSRMGPLKPRR